MEYVTYILICLGILALCMTAFWRKGVFSGNRSQSTGAPVQSEPVSAERLDVPTPWGWPGSESVVSAAEDRTVSDSLHRFVDHLISEKQTVEDSEYLLKRNENLRSLIEDRYGKPPSGNSTNGSRKKGVPVSGGSSLSINRGRDSLREIRKPWGW